VDLQGSFCDGWEVCGDVGGKGLGGRGKEEVARHVLADSRDCKHGRGICISEGGVHCYTNGEFGTVGESAAVRAGHHNVLGLGGPADQGRGFGSSSGRGVLGNVSGVWEEEGGGGGALQGLTGWLRGCSGGQYVALLV
jgi:hypothetical protein